MAMIVAGVVIVGLLVGFFALRKGDDGAGATDNGVVDDVAAAPGEDTFCANGAAPADGEACTLAEQNWTKDDACVIHDADGTAVADDWCTTTADTWGADSFCADACEPVVADDTAAVDDT